MLIESIKEENNQVTIYMQKYKRTNIFEANEFQLVKSLTKDLLKHSECSV